MEEYVYVVVVRWWRGVVGGWSVVRRGWGFGRGVGVVVFMVGKEVYFEGGVLFGDDGVEDGWEYWIRELILLVSWCWE